MFKINTEKDAQTKKYKVGDILLINGEKFQLIELSKNPYREETEWGLVCLKNGHLGLTLGESPRSIVCFYLNCWEEEDEKEN